MKGRMLKKWFELLVFTVTLICFTFGVTDEDCVRTANENPLKLNRLYQAHEFDCNKYYQCGRYGLVEFNCPEGLNFDRNLYICGRPREISC
jgi:Chitin binding Peritrophin-A domain